MARVDKYHNAQVAVDLEGLDENVSQGFFSKINFIGSGVSATQSGGDPQQLDVSFPGGAGVTDHGALTGLGDDDHVQYQLRTEREAASGYAGLDGSGLLIGSRVPYGTTSDTACEGDDTRLSDSRTPIMHESTHLSEGVDEIDGDTLDIDFSPTNYTPNMGSPESSSAVHLTSHLNGIDIQLGVLEVTLSAHGSLSGLGDDDHIQYQLRSEQNVANGYVGLTAATLIPGNLVLYGDQADAAVEGNDTRIPTQGENDAAQGTAGAPTGSNRFVTNSDTRNSDKRDPNVHANDHLLGGGDEVDADQLEIDFAPVSYVPSSAAPEVTDVKHLTSHLQGIDDALGIIGAADHGTLLGLGDDDHVQYQLRTEKDNALGYVGLDTSQNAGIGGNLDVGAGVDVTGNITITGTVDGRNIGADGTKLDTVETNAKDDQDADEVPYTNIASGLTATNVQAAIDEVDAFFPLAHSSTTGLGNDDHTQYQLRSEENSANGYAGLDAGTKLTGTQMPFGSSSNTVCEGNDSRLPSQDENNALLGTNGVPNNANRYVTNSDSRNTNARTPVVHSSTHERAGSDEIDGDILDITFIPLVYTRSTAPAEVTSTNDLTAHLKGIDLALGGTHAEKHINGGSDEIDGDRIDIDFAPTVYVPATTPPEASDLQDLAAHLYGIDQAIGGHADRHIQGGDDEVDGDKIDIDFAPLIYTPNAAVAEASDADHLTAHLKGIDDELGSIIFGRDPQTVLNASRSTTTSTTFQIKTSLTTPELTGTCRIAWNASLDHGSTNQFVEARLFNVTDTSELGALAKIKVNDTDEIKPVGGVTYIVFSGAAKTFQIQFRTNSAGTAAIQDARIEVWRQI